MSMYAPEIEGCVLADLISIGNAQDIRVQEAFLKLNL